MLLWQLTEIKQVYVYYILFYSVIIFYSSNINIFYGFSFQFNYNNPASD